jgi:hypothetical protein
MLSTTRYLAIAATAAILATALACGGSVASFPPDDPLPDAAPAPVATTAAPGVPGPVDASTAAGGDGSATVSLIPAAPLPCEQRAVPAKCARSDPPYYSAADLSAAWMACGGTSGVDDRCGVLTVSFDESGCASVSFTGMPPLTGAVACMEAQLGAYRFECSAGSGIALNHLCN